MPRLMQAGAVQFINLKSYDEDCLLDVYKRQSLLFLGVLAHLARALDWQSKGCLLYTSRCV